MSTLKVLAAGARQQEPSGFQAFAAETTSANQQSQYSHEFELSRKLGVFRGDPPVPTEHVAQAENAHTHGEPLVAHIGASPQRAVQGASPWV